MMSRARTRIVAFLTLLVAARGWADPETDSRTASEQSGTVILMLGQRDLAGEALTAAVRSQLADLPVTFSSVSEPLPRDVGARMMLARRVASEHDGRAVFWLEPDESGAVLFFMGPPFEGLYSRRLDSGDVRNSVIDEEVAVIVRSTVVALLHDSEVDMARVEVPPPAEPASHPPATSSRSPSEKRSTPPAAAPERLRVVVGYVGSSFSADAAFQHGAAFGLAVLPWKSLIIGGRYTLALPVSVDTDEASLRIFRHPGELSAGLGLPLDAFTLEPELAALIDYRTRSTTAASEGFDKRAQESQFAFGASARLRATARLLPAFSMFAAGGADFYAPRTEYVVLKPARETVLTTNAVMPRLEAGLILSPL
jgi:hypothetical protein